jgi:hypothetical protein
MKECVVDGCKNAADRRYCKEHSPGRSSDVHRQICSLRSGAKRRGIPFDLKVEDIVKLLHETKVCPVFGFPLVYGGSRWNSPSIDRVDNTKGYSLDNVVVMSMKANMCKNSLSVEELKMFAVWVNNL